MTDMQWGLIKLEQWTKKKLTLIQREQSQGTDDSSKYSYDPPPLYSGGKRVEFVESFKYLGVIFDAKLK